MKFHVEPAGDVRVPAHPVEGPMPSAGGAYWVADQYTLRLLLDEVIRRVPDEAEAESTVEPAPAAATEPPVTSAPAPVVHTAPDPDPYSAAQVGDSEEHH